MKKFSIVLVLVSIACLSMIFYVANLAEKDLKTVLSETQSKDFSIELLSYQRDFFTATALSELHILVDEKSPLTFQIRTIIHHYPHQAVLKNHIDLVDEEMAKKMESYFGTAEWINSVETINIFSQLTGELTVGAGKFKSESEALISEPLILNYQVDLKNGNADFNLNWGGLSGVTDGIKVSLNTLQLTSHVKGLSTQSDYDYQLKINEIKVLQENSHWLLEGVAVNGRNEQGLQNTIDTANELIINTYQIKTDEIQTFTDNHLNLAISGLYQPAFELLSTGAGDNNETEHALIELVNHGAQLTLSHLNSKTPWGDINGKLDLVLDKGSSLQDILNNPYVLFDYVSGNASLELPSRLLNEPVVAEQLQIAVMTGFLEEKGKTLNLQSSFQQGELVVNGTVIPL